MGGGGKKPRGISDAKRNGRGRWGVNDAERKKARFMNRIYVDKLQGRENGQGIRRV